MSDIKAWITVNGRHIPIMEGESKTGALTRHFKNIRNAKFKKYTDKIAEHDRKQEIAKEKAKSLEPLIAGYTKNQKPDEYKAYTKALNSQEYHANKKWKLFDERAKLSKTIKGVKVNTKSSKYKLKTEKPKRKIKGVMSGLKKLNISSSSRKDAGFYSTLLHNEFAQSTNNALGRPKKITHKSGKLSKKKR